jgi:ATPase subunit of ABC transporter with duplicated ATPase domains
VIKTDGAWEILKDAVSLHVGRGKKTVVYAPDAESKEEILQVSLGRTGNLRAPTLRVGENIYIGYNDIMYKELFG